MKKLLLVIAFALAFGGVSQATITFTEVQRCSAISDHVACTVSAGNLVVVHSLFFCAASCTCSTSDGGVTLTNTTGSPTGNAATTNACIAYILSTSSGAKTYTTTVTGTSSGMNVIFAEEFSYTGGAIAFDKGTCQAPSATATPVVLPTLTPTATGELLVAGIYPLGSITATNSPWTSSGSAQGGTQASYVLSSSSGATTVNWNDNTNPDSWASCIAAFGAAASATVPGQFPRIR